MKKLVINKAILNENIQKIKTHTESTIIATLKNNGYGLGLLEYPQILLENGIDFFAVLQPSEKQQKIRKSILEYDPFLGQ